MAATRFSIALADAGGIAGLFGGLTGDGLLLEVEEGEAVVARRIGSTGQHQLDRLVETVGSNEFGAGSFSRDLPKFRWTATGRTSWALQIFGSISIAFLDHQHCL
ncbi:MAG: hypothetical protein U5N27_02000 [Rhizobium sp.]|nr:hypothetical protein [Rhizobium sp.]